MTRLRGKHARNAHVYFSRERCTRTREYVTSFCNARATRINEQRKFISHCAKLRLKVSHLGESRLDDRPIIAILDTRYYRIIELRREISK